ncbi:p-glycoprotein [Gilbertella persicaria]|uniref:p-glycoprotein n=1 Tax=Gilbertella persicaria TaxID=101096 RepID=UPI00221F3A91|nr:p-glycoprotein [Gilbertella persicaria]KAI8083358.1 p-glycoprotein [Gilbertella persicaria]
MADQTKPKDKKKAETVSIWRLFQFATKLDRLLIFAAMICSCASGVIQPVSILFFGNVLKNLSDAIANNENLMDKVLPIILLYVYMGVGVLAAAYISSCLWILTGENQTRRIRQSYVHSILRQEMGWFDKAEEGSLTTRLAADIQLIQDGISEKFGQFLMCFAQFVAGCAVAFSKGWRLAAVMIAVTPALACTGGVMGILVTKFTVETQNAYADAGSISEQVFAGIRTVYSFSLQERFAKRYDDKLENAMRAGMKRGIILGIGLGVFMFCLFAMYGLSFWYGSGLVRQHTLDGATVLVVFLSMMMGEFSLMQLPTNLAAVSSASAAAYKIFETIQRVPDIDSDDQKGKVPKEIRGEIIFNHVKFKYPTRPDTLILKDLSLKVKPGMTVAFVGPSGSGKSTSVQLLQRFYDPLSGQVSLDGHDLKELNVKWLRQQIGVVSQEPVLFNMSIRQNLMMGSTHPNITFEDITAACKKANCHSFIKQLPQGYDTLVGEHGGMLSGGQKQRIAIARAILKNPAILLLDEATSALDTQSERLVQKALDEASTNRTTIVIAHRLSTVRNADLIVVMEQGNLIEQGTHSELLAKRGVYAQLVKKQEIQTSNEEDTDHETLLRNEAIDVNRRSCIELQQRGSSPSTVISMGRKSRYSAVDGYEEKRQREKQEKKGRKKMKAPVWRVLRQMRPQWGWMSLGCVGAAMAGSVFPMYSLFFSKVITLLNENDDKSYGPLEGPNLYSFLFVILGICAFFGFSLQVVCFEIAGAKYTRKLRSMLFTAFMKQEIGYFDRDENSVGSLTSKLAVDAKNVNEMITRVWADLIQILCTSVLGLTIAFAQSWKLTLIIMCMAPLIIAAAGWNSKVQEGFEGNTKDANEKSAEVANEAIKQIRTVTALNKQSYFEDKYYQATDRPHRLARRKAFTSSIGFALLQAIPLFTNAVAFYAGAKLIMQQQLSLNGMVMTMMSIMIMADGVGRSSVFIPIFVKAKIAAITAFEIIDRQPSIDPDLEGIEFEHDDIDGAISFDNVAFRYPARPDIPIFDGEFNLKGKSGQTIALVGPSGCGKSTTIGMLQRWYDPLKGTVRLDNHNVKAFSLHNLRKKMALVGQEPILFDLSIAENIRFGVDQDKKVGQHEVEEACKAANIHKFITSLPDGYQTRVGDKGSQLSGGQKQRIAIARALIRKPKLLLLDEATSALDSESEKLVQQALDSILEEGGRTTITIAHRLSTITNADLICVIKGGRVIEQGNHWSLLKLNGVYSDLVRQQSLNAS